MHCWRSARRRKARENGYSRKRTNWVNFPVLVPQMALRQKLQAITEEAAPYDDILHHLEQVKAVEITLDGKHYFAWTELVGHAGLAFRALGMRPHRGQPRCHADRATPGRNVVSHPLKPNNDKASQK